MITILRFYTDYCTGQTCYVLFSIVFRICVRCIHSSCYVKFIRLHLFSLCYYLHNSCCFKWMVAACLQVSKCYFHLSIIHCVSSSQLFTHESKLLIQHVCSIILSWCCSILQSFVQNLLCLICILLPFVHY